jgi:hypothetical protein
VYFVTICTQDHEEYFGKVLDGKIVLNEVGKVCEEELILTTTREGVDIVEWIIMPNHIHMLIHIDNVTSSVGTTRALSERDIPSSERDISNTNGSSTPDRARPVPTDNKIIIQNQSLGSIVGSFKSAVSRICHKK